MALQRTLPNYYSAIAPRSAASTGVAAIDFGFPATVLRIVNVANVDAYFNPASTSVCTTADMCVRACSDAQIFGVAMSVLTIYSTSTGATAHDLRIAALGG